MKKSLNKKIDRKKQAGWLPRFQAMVWAMVWATVSRALTLILITSVAAQPIWWGSQTVRAEEASLPQARPEAQAEEEAEVEKEKETKSEAEAEALAEAEADMPFNGLPPPGSLVNLSAPFVPVTIRGVGIDPGSPLSLNFIIDTGNSPLRGKALEQEALKLIKYFLTSLTIPDENLWVNLSPYEANRIIPSDFGKTEMGRELLAQDYLLKQITSSLMYPEEEIGKKFWEKIYAETHQRYARQQPEAQEDKGAKPFQSSRQELNTILNGLNISTYNKVWVVPHKAKAYQQNNQAYILEAHLKVLLEEDYLAQAESDKSAGLTEPPGQEQPLATEIIRTVIIPELEQEINHGTHFAPLRQIYHSLILATWFKKNLPKSLLGAIYVNRAKTHGMENTDPQANQKIYDQYKEALQTGVYNYIREDYDAASQQVIARKYFSGGMAVFQTAEILEQGPASPMIPSTPEAEILEARVILNTSRRETISDEDYAQAVQPQEARPSYSRLRAGMASQITALSQEAQIALRPIDIFHLAHKLTLIEMMTMTEEVPALTETLEALLADEPQADVKNSAGLLARLQGLGKAGPVTANQNYEIAHARLDEAAEAEHAVMALYQAMGAANAQQMQARLTDAIKMPRSPLMQVLANQDVLLGNLSLERFLQLVDKLPEGFPEQIPYEPSSDTDVITGTAILELLAKPPSLKPTSGAPLNGQSLLKTFWQRQARVATKFLNDTGVMPAHVVLPIKFQNILQGIFLEDIQEIYDAAPTVQQTLVRLILAKLYTRLTVILEYPQAEAIAFIDKIISVNPVLNNELLALKPLFTAEAQSLRNKIAGLTPSGPAGKAPKDTALAAVSLNSFTKGGMDLNPAFLTLELMGELSGPGVEGEEGAAPWPEEFEALNTFIIDGLTPLILNMEYK